MFRKRFVVPAIFATWQLFVTHTPAKASVIDTRAGGLLGNIPALETNVCQPEGLAVDSQGVVFVAETCNARVRKIDGGAMTTVAGSGALGFYGESVPAVTASMNWPEGLALFAGNVYLSDSSLNRVRKVDASGVITTVAGSGLSGFGGDGLPAINAQLKSPKGIATDTAGNLFIADSGNNRVRKVDTSGIITTVAGSANTCAGDPALGDGGAATAACLNAPSWVAVDASGNLFIADTSNNRVRKVNASGNISTVAGNGLTSPYADGGATSVSLYNPSGLALDPAGTFLLVADAYHHTIRKVDFATGLISTVAGKGTNGSCGDSGNATDLCLSSPRGVALDGFGTIYIADTGGMKVRMVDTSNWMTTVAGTGFSSFSGDGGPATQANLKFPHGIHVDDANNLYIADNSNNRIRKVDPQGVITTVAGRGCSVYGSLGPEEGVPATQACLSRPYDVVVDPSGVMYIPDGDNRRVRKVDTQGNITTYAGTGFQGWEGDGGAATAATLGFPLGLALGPDGSLYIVDNMYSVVRKVSPEGIISRFAGSGTINCNGENVPATSTCLTYPSYVTTDANGIVYIADTGMDRVKRVGLDGKIATVAGNGLSFPWGDGGPATSAGMDMPQDIQVDKFGNLYIADSLHHAVRQVGVDGIITTVIGSGSKGSYGDGSLPQQAGVPYPRGLALDANGNLYVSEGSDRVRWVRGPAIAVDPAALDFAVVAGAANPAGQLLSVGNSGVESLSWSLGSSASWLSASPTSGTESGTSSTAVTVSVNASGLALGTYSAYLTITAPGVYNSPQVIPVSLVVKDKVEVLRPAAGETLVAGSQYDVAWGVNLATAPAKIDVYYSTNANSKRPNWNVIAKGLAGSTRSTRWSVPLSQASSSCQIKVVLLNSSKKTIATGFSGFFTITE